MKDTIYIGIDPGYREAGIGVVDEKGDYIDSFRLKNWTAKDFIDTLKMIEDEFMIGCIGIEEVHTFPGQGVVSSGNFMLATGIIIGILTALHLPFIKVRPRDWRSDYPITAKKKEERKKEALNYIREKYPEVDFNLEVYHNVAEALLIADHVRRKQQEKE